MNFIIEILMATWDLLVDASVYILFGLLVAGLLRVFLNPNSIAKHLGQGRFKSVFKAAFFVFTEKKQDPNDMVETMIELCTISRRQGLISLSRMEIEDDLLRKACNLIADGSKEDLIRDNLHIEIESMKQRHFIVQDVFRKMAIYAPSFGMMGTLIGLVQILGVDSFSSIEIGRNFAEFVIADDAGKI